MIVRVRRLEKSDSKEFPLDLLRSEGGEGR
jgi:hypothetical protein